MIESGVAAAKLPNLVGRDAELLLLHRRLTDALQGQSSLVLLSGEAGIGKTSLAQGVAGNARQEGAMVALGRCYEGNTPAFGLWQDVLMDLGASDTLDLAALPHPFGSGPPVQSAYQLMLGVVAALRSIATDRALVLLLDDVHWADHDSLELLELLTRRLERVSMLVILTFRSEEVHRYHALYELLPRLLRDRPVENIKLHQIDRTITAAIAETYIGPCNPQLIDSLQARSEGNPFFLVELLRDLKEYRTLAHLEEIPTLSISGGRVPIVLQQVIMRRISRLGGDTEQLLQVASVVGEEWDLSVVEAVLERPEEQLLRALESALEAQVVAPVTEGSERYRFTHGLLREVLVTQQVARRRKHVHERIAGALRDKTVSAGDRAAHTAALARHYYAAEQWREALQSSVAAGDAARDRYASLSALHFYEQALEISERVTDIDPEVAGALFDRLGQMRLVLNRLEAARSAFQHMVRVARAGGTAAAQAHALYWLSFVQTRLSNLKEARAAADASVEIAQQAGDPRVLAAGHWNLGRIYLVSGELERSRRHIEEAERLARLEGDSTLLGRCLKDQATLSIWHGHYARAENQSVEGLDSARAGRDMLFLAGLCWMLGIAYGELGHYSRALEMLQKGLTYTAEVDNHHYPVKLLNTLGWLHNEIGNPEEALLYDQRALELSRQGPADRIPEAECYCLLNLATDSMQQGDVEAAERRLQEFEATDRGIEHTRFRYLNRYHLVRGQLALARSEPLEAMRWVKEAGALAAEKGMRKNLAKSRMLAGQALTALNQSKEAILELRKAVGLADELRHGSLRWQARVQLARAQVAANQTDDAVRTVRGAQDFVIDLAAEFEDEQHRQTFLNSAPVQEMQALLTSLQKPDRQPAYPAGLTAREVEVLRLVAQGATNKVIAGTLYISVKTVNAHLNSIFSKVDCSNRASAAAFAFRHGLH